MVSTGIGHVVRNAANELKSSPVPKPQINLLHCRLRDPFDRYDMYMINTDAVNEMKDTICENLIPPMLLPTVSIWLSGLSIASK
mmetsp:Transcript_6429/g.9775  ORF Transcript_6429/g.9775 Transcript_6429/m.9775 type:complete len:84 (+) Transcript_6429:2781-3032(+)